MVPYGALFFVGKRVNIRNTWTICVYVCSNVCAYVCTTEYVGTRGVWICAVWLGKLFKNRYVRVRAGECRLKECAERHKVFFRVEWKSRRRYCEIFNNVFENNRRRCESWIRVIVRWMYSAFVVSHIGGRDRRAPSRSCYSREPILLVKPKLVVMEVGQPPACDPLASSRILRSRGGRRSSSCYAIVLEAMSVQDVWERHDVRCVLLEMHVGITGAGKLSDAMQLSSGRARSGHRCNSAVVGCCNRETDWKGRDVCELFEDCWNIS
jgi:hypothetical protein